MPVTILMASFHGAAHIGAQIDSIVAQDHAHWHLVVSDDGSGDDTRSIVSGMAAQMAPGRIRLIDGPGRGATQNFLSLLDHVPDGHAAAFCDQDDVWFPDKLSRAMAAMTGQRGPVHYAAGTIIAGPDLTPLAPSRRFLRPLSLRNALVQAVMAGNASVFSPDAVAILRKAAGAARTADVPSHDWWAYQIMAATGAHLIHEPAPCLLYRQHAQAEMGRNDTARALWRRFGMVAQGDYGAWLSRNHLALIGSSDLMTPQAADLVAGFDRMLDRSGTGAVMDLRRLGLYRQTRAGNVALSAAALAGLLRRR